MSVSLEKDAPFKASDIFESKVLQWRSSARSRGLVQGSFVSTARRYREFPARGNHQGPESSESDAASRVPVTSGPAGMQNLQRVLSIPAQHRRRSYAANAPSNFWAVFFRKLLCSGSALTLGTV